MSSEGLIDTLSELCGIVPEYHDIWGNLVKVPHETKLSLLQALGYRVQTPSSIEDEIREIREKGLTRMLEPVKVFRNGDNRKEISIFVPSRSSSEPDASLKVRITGEDSLDLTTTVFLTELGDFRTHTFRKGEVREYIFPLTMDLKEGYYSLNADLTSGTERLHGVMRLIIAPGGGCFMPDTIEGGRRVWGLSVNLYAVRSGRNHGVGDLADLDSLVRWIGGELGGDFVAINPLHSIPNSAPYGISPYFPLSRLFHNPLYIDIDGVEDVLKSKQAVKILQGHRFREEVRRLKEEDLVDYGRAYRLKLRVLEAGFRYFLRNHYMKGSERGKAFSQYVADEGGVLKAHSTFMALYDHFSRAGLCHWRDWPTEYHLPDTDEVRAFQGSHRKRILFHMYLQWLLHGRIAAIQEMSEDLGMTIGLYCDLALGSADSGSDVWADRGSFVRGVEVGAPPDDFSLRGQNWGLPPLNPERMREDGYEFFVRLFRKNLSLCGAMRIDHALGLFRLFWIPQGMEPQKGTYVKYPHEELLRIIALESVKNRTLIIAEDLGTVGDEVRDALRRYGMLSFRLLYFERDYNSSEFLAPEAYPEMAIASATTHDLPTLAGFWAGRDIEVKRELRRYPDDETYRHELLERGYDRWRLLRALGNRGLLPEGISADPGTVKEMNEDLVIAIYRYLGMTPARLLVINLDDILLTPDQQNLPGTIDEYPNWRRKIPLNLEELSKKDVFRRLKKIRNS